MSASTEPEHRRSRAAAESPWSPLADSTFRALWTASLVSNVGTWMQSVGGAWLMTSLTTSPLPVALMQSATSLPVFLVGLPAGALADLVDRRRLLLLMQGWMMLCALALGLLTLGGYTTPFLLLLLTFGLGMGATIANPAWQATTPEVVRRQLLPTAIALNGAGFNVSRAVGPALGGAIVAAFGPAVNFLLNGVSFLGTILVLSLWNRVPLARPDQPEGLWGATRAGLRYARHSPGLRAVLGRSGLFILCASALWALLPLIARQQLGLEASGYGLLVGSLGIGAVSGALVLPRFRQRFTADQLVLPATLLFAAMLLVLAWAPSVLLDCLAMALAGIGWMVINSCFQVAVQTSAPAWVRARVIGIYLLVFQGGLALGSAGWGVAAEAIGNSQALSVAAFGLALGLAVVRRWPLREVREQDVRPSPAWPLPTLHLDPLPRQGPVLVTSEYRVPAANQPAFVDAMHEVERLRRRDGALRWDLFQDPEDPTRFLEVFQAESWADHMRQHDRTVESDRSIERRAFRLTANGGPFLVRHLVSAQPGQVPAEPG